MVTSKRVKVKLFGSDEKVEIADAEVSKWIEANPNIEIQEIKITGAGSKYVHYIISIAYIE